MDATISELRPQLLAHRQQKQQAPPMLDLIELT
jgi:hypothetical protein